MSLTNYPNGVSSFGVPLTGQIPMVLGVSGVGNIYFVDATNGSDGNNGKSPQKAFATAEVAYAAAASGDTIALSTSATHSIALGINHTKSRINWVGLDFGGRQVQQGAKIQLATASASAYVLKNTGVRNSFTNIKFIQAATAATALHVLEDGSEGSLYQNCSFVFGVNSNIDLTTAHEVVAGSDSATFLNCTFGADTLLTTANRSVFHIDQVTTSQEFKSNILENCNFIISSSETLATFVRLDAVGDILFTNLFKNCTFIASVDSAGGVALAEASQTGTSTVKGVLCYVNPAVFNCTDFSTATGGRNAATQVVATTSTAGTAGVGVTPTA